VSDIIKQMGLDHDDLKWYQLAACNSMDINWFYDSYESDVYVAEQADNVCLHCPVARKCLVEGISNKEYGVWGGVYLHLGRVDKSANMHKTDDTWKRLNKIHGRKIH
jgi:hypothetical protein